MINNRNIINLAFALIVTIMILQSCGRAGGNETGTEFMPDMGHSVAYEANVYNYYHLNTWDDESVFKLKELSNPREPVAGTVARGYVGAASGGSMAKNNALLTGTYNSNAIRMAPNGSVPYYYGDNDSERARAIDQIITNPFPITEAGIERGKELYITFCGICHGEKGGADGYLARDGSPYPAAPANFLTTAFRDTSNGAYYHAIMHGKNVMGGYADKISYEERWQVIHYIRAMQAKEFKLEYSETANTLNRSAIPGASYVNNDSYKASELHLPEIFSGHAHSGGHGHDDDHGHGDDHSDHDHDADGHGDHDDHDHSHDDNHNH